MLLGVLKEIVGAEDTVARGRYWPGCCTVSEALNSILKRGRALKRMALTFVLEDIFMIDGEMERERNRKDGWYLCELSVSTDRDDQGRKKGMAKRSC